MNLSRGFYPVALFLKPWLCNVLEALVVQRAHSDNVTIFTVIVPSLKSLFLRESTKKVKDDACGFVIDAPSLECLDIVDHKGGKILSSITSVKRLSLCLRNSKDACPVGSVFCSLLALEICTCKTEWLNLLLCILRDSPKLQTLKLDMRHSIWDVFENPRQCWVEPNSVPDCLLSSLETLEWVKYEGREEEKELVAFILRSGCCLKKVIISSTSTDPNKKLELLKELSLSFRGSSNIWLV